MAFYMENSMERAFNELLDLLIKIVMWSMLYPPGETLCNPVVPPLGGRCVRNSRQNGFTIYDHEGGTLIWPFSPSHPHKQTFIPR